MPYDLYSTLSGEQREHYDLMLETNYVLLRCDEWAFLEEDEQSTLSRSVSWIQSLQPTLPLFGLDPSSYPQGSISANRHYYEALRNYLGGAFPSNPTFNFLRQGLSNLLRLRRDDSSANLSYLFGSYYRISETLGGREPKKYRHVEVNLRHSATALWILCEESNGTLTEPLQNSLVAFMDRLRRYLSKNEDWEKDSYRHLTLASALNTFDATVRRFHSSDLTRRAKRLKDDCRTVLLSASCIARKTDGEYAWCLPSVNKSRMAKYEFYLDAFVLTQVPQLLESPKAQSVVRGMLANKIDSNFGYGIPLHKLTGFSKLGDAAPDFGATASCLFLLWYCLSNGIGGAEWLDFCGINVGWLLSFCLGTYDQKSFYLLPHSENNTKVLLLPRYNHDRARAAALDQLIYNFKLAINGEMERKGKLNSVLRKIPDRRFAHVKEIIRGWQIPRYWRDQTSWEFTGWSEVGQVIGGLAVGTLKGLGSIP
jgi:hypothetical protein